MYILKLYMYIYFFSFFHLKEFYFHKLELFVSFQDNLWIANFFPCGVVVQLLYFDITCGLIHSPVNYLCAAASSKPDAKPIFHWRAWQCIVHWISRLLSDCSSDIWAQIEFDDFVLFEKKVLPGIFFFVFLFVCLLRIAVIPKLSRSWLGIARALSALWL